MNVARQRILDGQEAMLRALSDPALLGKGSAAAPETPDADRHAVVARLAHAKRMAKIRTALPRTCAALGDAFDPAARDFARAYPPRSASTFANALQFYRFLAHRWNRRAASPPYLRDLVACEIALAALAPRERAERGGAPSGRLMVRRAPGVRLRACAFDVRALFDPGSGENAALAERAAHVAIVADPAAGEPRLIGISAGLFGLLRSLSRWTVLPASAGGETSALVRRLESAQLVELAEPAAGA